jgi:hypothetical protein
MARTLELDTITEPSNSGTANITLSSNTTTTMPLVDINGGAIDATTLGAGTPSSVAATTLTTSGNATFGDAIGDATTVTGTLAVAGTLGVTGVSTFGTISSGTWEGTTVAVAQGGTGVTSKTGTGSVVLSASPTFTGTVSGVTKAHVGLSNVDNTADASQTTLGTLTSLTGGTGDLRWNGTASSTAFFVDYSTAKIGIGVDNPGAKVEIYAPASGLDPDSHLKLRASASDGDYLGILFSAYSGNQGKGWFGFERRPSSGNGGGDFVFILDSAANNDNVSTGDAVMRIANSGAVTSTGGFSTSDERLKENITTITGGLEKINALTGRTFTWKEETNLLTGTHYGLIAQEVESIIPGLVYNESGIRKLDKDGNIKNDDEGVLETDEFAKSLSMEGFIPVLIEAVKELSAKVKALETA